MFISPEFREMERLVEVVKRHQGLVAATQTEATHVILQAMESSPLGEGRIVLCRRR